MPKLNFSKEHPKIQVWLTRVDLLNSARVDTRIKLKIKYKIKLKIKIKIKPKLKLWTNPHSSTSPGSRLASDSPSGLRPISPTSLPDPRFTR